MGRNSQSDLKQRIAREAAILLYYGSEKEYRQAKLKAAKTLRSRFLPSNLEVALELDNIAEETEGPRRKERLIKMRKEALEVMKLFRICHPLLIGSVWRGTIKKGSDIDIALYNDNSEQVIDILREKGSKITGMEQTVVTKQGQARSSFHIHLETPTQQEIEIVIRSTEERGEKRKCEIFGDELKGLNLEDLEMILKNNPAQRFLPS